MFTAVPARVTVWGRVVELLLVLKCEPLHEHVANGRLTEADGRRLTGGQSRRPRRRTAACGRQPTFRRRNAARPVHLRARTQHSMCCQHAQKSMRGVMVHIMIRHDRCMLAIPGDSQNIEADL